MESGTIAKVAFYFDPICPWAYQASKWIREVRDRLGVTVEWRFLSLGELNRRQNDPHEWERRWAWGWSLLRVAAQLRSEDPGGVDRWYAEIGRQFHEDAVPVYRYHEARAAAERLGIADVFDRAQEDPTTHDVVRADHEHVVSTYSAFGVPTLVLDDRQAVFGPKITPAPTGDDALRLWDVVTAWAAVPNLFQLRTPMTAADLTEMDRVFEPYYRSRAWGTNQRSVVEESTGASNAETSGDACALPTTASQ